MFTILKKERLSSIIVQMEIKAERIAKKAKAGQFIIVRQDNESERIPLTIADFDQEKGSITIIYQEVGNSTKKLSELNQGDNILDLVGPLGQASEIENCGTVVCIGGGVGIAPIFPIARALKEAGNHVISIIGARSQDILFWQEKMASVSDELLIATDDGSIGRKGFVTDILKDILEKQNISKVWAIGPMVMMKAVANTTRPFDVHTIVSLNPIMVDGTGMCGACRVAVGNETKFACVDGPEFDGHLVDFDLAIRRLNMFKDEEKRAQASGQCGGGCGCHQTK